MWNGIDVGGRAVIARMPPSEGEAVGKLLVHSPVEWTPELGEALSGLGEVGALISPNYEHVKFIAQWSERYPRAQVWGCPGLPSRMPQVGWTHEFNADPLNAPTSLEALWLDCEINPFTARPFFNEMLFYRAQSKTLFLTDFWWNYPSSDRPNYDGVSGTGSIHACPRLPVSLGSPEPAAAAGSLPSVPVPAGTRAWKLGMHKVYLPFYRRCMVGRRGERRQRYEQLARRVLAWDVEVLVPCHGDVVRGRELCREVLESHWAL